MKRKYFLIAFLVVILLGITSILWMWNEPFKKVESEAEIALTVDKLCHDFTANEDTANNLYLHKAIQLKGQIMELTNDMDGGILMVFAASNNIDDVECVLREKTAELKIGSVVTVKGFCTGKTITGIALSDCIIVAQ